jgi:hydrogenase nickel incorporation protein HypA/HybF
MHELAIANSVLEAVNAELRLRPGTRLSRIGLRIGDLAGVESEALSFCYEALVKGTELEAVALETERRAWRQECPRCRDVFMVVDYQTVCPACGESQTEFLSGDEPELAFLEVEDP